MRDFHFGCVNISQIHTDALYFTFFHFVSMIITKIRPHFSLSLSLGLRALGLKPKRTLRLVLWTDEEAGGVGSQQYYNAHKTEADNYSVLLESDEGVFTPYGMMFTGSDSAMKVFSWW